ncbi:Putative TauD/TfdA-like domain, taurine dioxygenase TauD-like superfamily [Colletotrichum destructivum]|uniref:TauD/TfdA-like domain, taurine dioxygenase TauD-like superfamily n=1 Tax=Colletotrichum destructivum TaxID=34406 RepID=A0AAX4J4B1_9PEZI|nr:Putative TauD/TfdA-like domain, taurine dioxygenase TauD-like superfamily [Colletotrichum destructivum]
MPPNREPLARSGALDDLEWRDLTPVIGREFPKAQLKDIMTSDAMLRDLAINVSERNVVFFRNQTINASDMKIIAQKLGELTGKPPTSKVSECACHQLLIFNPSCTKREQLHRHTLSNSKRGDETDEGTVDDEVTVISNKTGAEFFHEEPDRLASEGWHSDISTERIPSDYAIFKMRKLPNDSGAGGDTLWASGYEAFDRLSKPLKRLAEGLTATHFDDVLCDIGRKTPEKMLSENRGSPENHGLDFEVSHPVVRTNPVTNWKSLYGACGQIAPGKIDGVPSRESDMLKQFFLDLIAMNHDLQVRWRWSENDVAIWDNDYCGLRLAQRVASVGEKPYYDPSSVSRREHLRRQSEAEKTKV